MAELEIDGVSYRTGRLNAKQQFHVARRIAPIIARIGTIPALIQEAVAQEAMPNGNGVDYTEGGTEGDTPEVPEAQSNDLASLMERGGGVVFKALAEAISELSDRDCDYILAMCLSVVMRRHGESWVPVWNKAADQPQFADLNLPGMMQLTFAVIQDNLAGFMPAQGLPGRVPPGSSLNAR